MARLAVLILVLLAGLGPRTADSQPCPETCTTNVVGYVCSTAAARDTSTSESCYPNPGLVESRAMYDLVLGTILATATSCYFAPNNGAAAVHATDRFRLVGPAGGSQVSFLARLQANGSAGGNGTVSAGIREVGGGSASVNDGGFGGFAQLLVLPLLHAVGEEFELVYEVNASAEFGAQAQGALSFAGLPPGYGVASCQGFAGEGAVPARPASWGALKVRYH